MRICFCMIPIHLLYYYRTRDSFSLWLIVVVLYAAAYFVSRLNASVGHVRRHAWHVNLFCWIFKKNSSFLVVCYMVFYLNYEKKSHFKSHKKKFIYLTKKNKKKMHFSLLNAHRTIYNKPAKYKTWNSIVFIVIKKKTSFYLSFFQKKKKRSNICKHYESALK